MLTVKDNIAFVTISKDLPQIAFRPSSPDYGHLREIFMNNSYFLPIKDFQPKFILDCGANIGGSAIYFTLRYPNAKVLAVEPESSNFDILKANTAHYKNIECLHSALWNKVSYIKVIDPYHAVDAFMTVDADPKEPGAMKATTVSKLLEDSGFDEIDILKVDIEGAEKEVFEESRGGGGYLK